MQDEEEEKILDSSDVHFRSAGNLRPHIPPDSRQRRQEAYMASLAKIDRHSVPTRTLCGADHGSLCFNRCAKRPAKSARLET